MAIRIVPYSASETEAALAFNRRMSLAQAKTEFLLPEAPPLPSPVGRALRSTYFLAVDDDAVRGGLVVRDCPAWLDGADVAAANCIAPLSEGAINRRYSFLAICFLKFLLRQSPFVFSVGMGDPENPYPRVLRAAGWTLVNVPFFFKVFRASRFLRQLSVFRQSTARKLGAEIAAATGLGALAVAALDGRSIEARKRASGLALSTPRAWESWADDIWSSFRQRCSFAVARDARMLCDLYPIADPSLHRFLLFRDQRPVAWAVALNTQMNRDKYFGDLRVATILDCVGYAGELAPAVFKVSEAMAAAGAELVISNQLHGDMTAAFAQAGFFRAPSNYQAGLSKPLMERVNSGLGPEAIHLTRGDGDGRMHL